VLKRKVINFQEPGPHRPSYAGPARRYVLCGPGQIFGKSSKSRKMRSLEEKSDQFTRRKIQGFGSGNFAGCLRMLQRIQNPGK